MKKVFEVGGRELASVHADANKRKFYCYFTGFLEGVVSSGAIELGEIDPLIALCEDFVENVQDSDANDIFQDFSAQLLDFEALESILEIRNDRFDPACEKSQMNRFLGLCTGVSCDGRITVSEAERIVDYGNEYPFLASDIFCRNVLSLCREAVDDGIISDSEEIEISDAIARLVGDAYRYTGISELGSVPVFEAVELSNDISVFDGATIVLTGNFSVRPRSHIEERLKSFGAVVDRSVTKRTSYILVAAEASRDWVYTHKGTKLLKAEKYRQQSGMPKYLAEYDVLETIGLGGAI